MVADRALGAGLGSLRCSIPKTDAAGLQVALPVTPAPGFPERYKLFTNEVKCAVAAEHYQTAISTFGLS